MMQGAFQGPQGHQVYDEQVEQKILGCIPLKPLGGSGTVVVWCALVRAMPTLSTGGGFGQPPMARRIGVGR